MGTLSSRFIFFTGTVENVPAADLKEGNFSLCSAAHFSVLYSPGLLCFFLPGQFVDTGPPLDIPQANRGVKGGARKNQVHVRIVGPCG